MYKSRLFVARKQASEPTIAPPEWANRITIDRMMDGMDFGPDLKDVRTAIHDADADDEDKIAKIWKKLPRDIQKILIDAYRRRGERPVRQPYGGITYASRLLKKRATFGTDSADRDCNLSGSNDSGDAWKNASFGINERRLLPEELTVDNLQALEQVGFNWYKKRGKDFVIIKTTGAMDEAKPIEELIELVSKGKIKTSAFNNPLLDPPAIKETMPNAPDPETPEVKGINHDVPGSGYNGNKASHLMHKRALDYTLRQFDDPSFGGRKFEKPNPFGQKTRSDDPALDYDVDEMKMSAVNQHKDPQKLPPRTELRSHVDEEVKKEITEEKQASNGGSLEELIAFAESTTQSLKHVIDYPEDFGREDIKAEYQRSYEAYKAAAYAAFKHMRKTNKQEDIKVWQGLQSKANELYKEVQKHTASKKIKHFIAGLL